MGGYRNAVDVWVYLGVVCMNIQTETAKCSKGVGCAYLSAHAWWRLDPLPLASPWSPSCDLVNLKYAHNCKCECVGRQISVWLVGGKSELAGYGSSFKGREGKAAQ